MVNFEVPTNYTFSPSEGTPHLTINREATIDLDSSNAFEGPEKLLEVWFAPAADVLPITVAVNGLKCVSAETWKEMLDVVNCKVLSIVESEHVDAYLLSESSMFVFSHKIILKTCGTTTLLWGLPRILEIAASKAGFPHLPHGNLKSISAGATPYRVFYSRKNFLFPDRQHGPHRSWKDEVRYMDKIFSGGSAYMVGKMNGDHWYLYLTGPNENLTPPATPDRESHVETKVLQVPKTVAAFRQGVSDDETLEILMTDLEPENAKQFYLENATSVAEGKYFQRANEARREAASSFGELSDVQSPTLRGATNNGLSAQDVMLDFFSNTSSSDDGGLTPDEDIGNFPEELATEGHALGTVVSEACGLSEVYPKTRYPDSRVDAYLFTPCGFSANGVIPAPGGAGSATHYFTVHVTPEPQCSYASFETNVPSRQSGRETAEVVDQVVSIFKPGRFSVTLFEARANECDGDVLGLEDSVVGAKLAAGHAQIRKLEAVKGYRRVGRSVHTFDGYDLVFCDYERMDWKGGAPRLGERM